MEKFIICLKEDVKDDLLKNGFKLIYSVANGNGNAYTFENKVKFNFSENVLFTKNNIMFTNKLMF